MRKVGLLALSALLVSAVASPGYAAGSDAKDKMVCKTKPKTGTRFGTKVCRTAQQWEQITEENRRTAAEMVNRPQIEIRRDQ